MEQKKTNKTNSKSVKVSSEDIAHLREYSKQRSETNAKSIAKRKRGDILTVLGILFIIFLIGFGAVSLIKGLGNKDEKKEMIKVPLVIDFEKDLSEEAYSTLNDGASKEGLTAYDLDLDNLFTGAGVEAPDINLLTRDNKILNLSKIDGPVVVEFIADWCTYCQMESQLYLNDTIDAMPDVTFVQILLTGGEEEFAKFYRAAQNDPHPKLIMGFGNSELDQWLTKARFESFPSFYFIDKNKKVNGFELGAAEVSTIKAIGNVAFGNGVPLYEMKDTMGTSLTERMRRVNIAIDYINSLESIDVPKELIEESN